MQRTAATFVICGLSVLLLGWLLAFFTALPQAQASRAVVMSTPAANTCFNCHEDIHAEWLSAYTVTFKIPPAAITPTSDALTCSTCHTQRTDIANDDQLAEHFQRTKARVEALRVDLTRIHDTHPEWQNNQIRAEKPESQITAERIDTLLTFIEADGSWGFHRPDYIDGLLIEAELLMADLLKTLEMK